MDRVGQVERLLPARLTRRRVTPPAEADDVGPDDRRFLMIRVPGGSNEEVVYVENWFTELRAKMEKK